MEAWREGRYESGRRGGAWRSGPGPRGDWLFPSLLGPRGALVKVYVWTGGLHGGHVQSWADLWRRLLRVYVGVCVGIPVDVDTEAGSCTRVWHLHGIGRSCPSPHAHADTRSHPGRHDAQALPGPDTRPARRRNWKFQSGLGPQTRSGDGLSRAAGWERVIMGWWGPHHPAWLCVSVPLP